jgi:hypothetical protein
VSITARIASAYTGETVRVELDGVVRGTLTAPATGWQSYADRTLSNIALSAGSHTLRLVFENGQVNLNYVDVRAARIALPFLKSPLSSSCRGPRARRGAPRSRATRRNACSTFRLCAVSTKT